MEIRENRSLAYEIKFVLPAALAEELRAWARPRLERDPHAEGGDLYRTTSLYYDTSAFDVFHRRGSFGRAKYRIRRYGESSLAFLERKLRSDRAVTKRRTLVNLVELERLRNGCPDPAWSGNWFHRRLLARALSPVCQISYRRTALVGPPGARGVRLTLDDELCARPISAPGFQLGGGGTPMLPGQAILELKFRVAMPQAFEELVANFALEPQTISKYRLAIAAMECAGAA
jgi:hypothetical protein